MTISDNPRFIQAIADLPNFIADANPDIDMAYDWIAEMCEIPSFFHDNKAWDLFYAQFTDHSNEYRTYETIFG